MNGPTMDAVTAAPALSAEHAQLVLEVLPQLAWMARADGYVQWYNRRWHEYTGTKLADMEGWGWQAVHDPAVLPEVMARWQESIRTGGEFEMELPLRGADGRFRLFLTRAVPVRGPDGAVQHWVGTNTDVSAHHESRLTLQLALNAAALTVFVWDVQRDELLRYGSNDDVLRQTSRSPGTVDGVRARVFRDDRAAFDANLAAALRDSQGTYRSEFRLLASDGTWRWVSECGRVEFGADGKPRRLIGVSQDITERKEVELRLAQSQLELQRQAVQLESTVAERTARLQELVNELGTFSYSVSHDLRAPLRSIQGFAELLREDAAGQLPEDSKSHLDRIIRSAHRMDELIRDVLEYSRITRAELTIEKVDPSDIARETIETVQQSHPDARITVEVPLHAVCASRPALTQCMSNLIGNAVKFVAAGVVPQVRVRSESAGPNVRIWIEDNGIGIAPEYRDRIWGMLERLNSKYEGTGVGLSIVKKAVERMNGRVGVESEPGKGSRFWIELPRAD